MIFRANTTSLHSWRGGINKIKEEEINGSKKVNITMKKFTLKAS
jgi:hypothetical protein